MTKYEVTIRPLPVLPMVVGDVVQLNVPDGTRVRAAVMHDGKVALVLEVPTHTGSNATLAVMVVPCDTSFSLPANHTFLGVVCHPKHGHLCVYDVTY